MLHTTLYKTPLLLLIAFAIAMSPLFAREASADYVCYGTNECVPGEQEACQEKCKGSTNPTENICSPVLPPDTCETLAGTIAAEKTKSGERSSWLWQGLFDISVGFVLKFLNFLLYGISTVLERLVALSAFLLEMSIDVSSAPFSDLTILQNGWKIVRDVMNSFFVLILFIIAIATILQLESYAWKSLLPRFIIIALLVNFSFVLSGVVIDFSNVLGRTFFDKMKPIDENIAKAFDINNINNIALASCDTPTTSVTGMASTIISYSKGWSCAGDATLQKLFVAHEEIAKTPMSDIGGLTKHLFILTLRVIMLFLMIFPLLAGAALMIMRTVMLMVLIIFSPAAFAAYILPATRSYTNQWYTQLFSFSLFFPSYMFLLYIAINYGIQIGNALKATGTQLGGTFENLATIFNFLTMVAFMFIALSVGRKSGIYGAETVLKYADAGRKWATGYAGRMTGVPRLAEKYAQSDFAQRFAARGFLLGAPGRGLMKLAQRGAKAGGREEALKARTDAITKLAPRFQADAYLRAGAPIRRRVEEQTKTEGMAEMLHYLDDQGRRDKFMKATFAYQPKDEKENNQRKLRDAYADREGNKQSVGQLTSRWNAGYYSPEEQKTIVDEMKTERRARLLGAVDNVKEVEDMIADVLKNNARELDKTREEIARYNISLPPDQFLPYFNKLSEETKRRVFDIINPRELERHMAGFADAATLGSTPTGLSPAQIAALTPTERAQYEQKQFLNAANALGVNRNNIKVRNIIGAVRPTYWQELGYGSQQELVEALSPAEAASMREEDMKQAVISQHFDGGQLEAIGRSNRISPETRKQVRAHVEAYIAAQRSGFLGLLTPAEIDRLDRLEQFLNRSPAFQ